MPASSLTMGGSENLSGGKAAGQVGPEFFGLRVPGLWSKETTVWGV